MSLSAADRDAFLAESHVAGIAVARRADHRGPLNVPVWYWRGDDGDLRVFTGADSLKARLVGRAGRFTLLVQRTEPTYRYVSVEGPVVGSAPTTSEDVATVAARYLPPDRARAYVERTGATGDPSEGLVTFRMRPEQWYAADLGAL
ncbi:pyridoxamine 5'-phosphate oxidase family protein [Streptomyces sp. NPDC007088]|uniref:pyridoxamine 5'-phosphate oxidase family protein n=1 Tax=Streptomyces sp. NPDC007088 TaxID=3364773 RepID=UPI00369E6DDC